MAIVFPASPSVNETFTEGSITYKWDGAKWIGLGITPADRLVEGSNSLEINANNDLVWTGSDVGIGTNAPGSDGGTTLEIYNATTPTLKLNDGDEYKALLQLRGNDLEIRGSNGVMEFYTGSADGASSTKRLSIDSIGRTLIHTSTSAGYADRWLSIGDVTDSSSTLEIRSSPTNGYSSIVFTDATSADSNSYIGAIEYAHQNNTLAFKTNATERLRIDSDGRIATNGRAPSSYNNPAFLISGDNATLTIMGDGSTNNSSISAIKFRVAGTSTGDYTKAAIFAKRMGGYNDLDMIFALDTAADANGVNLANERFRIKSNGDLKHTGLRIGGGDNKLAILVTPSHNTNEEDVIVYQAENEGSFNQITFGGGTSSYNAATELVFKTADIVDTTGGTERLRIDATGKIMHSGGHTNNSGNLSAGSYYRIVASSTVAASANVTFVISGLASGWMTIRGGGYSNAGQSQYAIMYQLGGFMTATSTYNVETVQQWGNGVTINTQKNASDYRITLINNSSSYGLATQWCIECANAGIKIRT